jgi:uncharacterized protein (TIGR02996 family)
VEPLAALTEALEAWRKTRSPRFAAIAQWATVRALTAQPARPPVGMSGKKADSAAWLAVLEKKDVLDVPRLIVGIGGGLSALATERATLLAKLDDPRVIDGLLALLEAPPYRAGTALGFFRATAKLLADSKDPRVRQALLDLSDRYPAIIDTTVGHTVAALLRRTAEGLEQVKPGPLPAAMEKKCATLEALFDTERSQTQRTTTTKKTAQHGDDALLSAIYAAPDDDTPRLVFADTLTERGDLRGEFISLQIARSQGRATPAQRRRERELLIDNKQRTEWSMPLSRGGDCRLTRGFPSELNLDPRSMKNVVDLPALATLTNLVGLERQPPFKHVKALLESSNLKALQRADGFTRKLFEDLELALPWRDVGLRFLPARDELRRLPNVRRLSVANGMEPTTSLRPDAFAELGALEALQVGTYELPSAEVFAPLVNLVELIALTGNIETPLTPVFAALPKLRDLTLHFAPTAAQLAGLKLERLTVRLAADLDALFEAVPTLRELTVQNMWFEAPAAKALFAARHFGHFQKLGLGTFTFDRPFTAEGELTLRISNRNEPELARHASVLKVLPDGCVRRVLVRPPHDLPGTYEGAPFSPQEHAVLSAGVPVPVELAWH